MIDVNQVNQNLVANGFLNNLVNKVELAVATEETAVNPLAFTNYQALTADIVFAIAS